MVKFSVKKPLTVMVAVVAIIVLGVVAFTGMTPDLLPNLDLPYVVVVTAYPGSTPEKTETTVTRPLEQAMATLENIESINSTSSENVSVLMLEFTADANLDTVSVDILQNIEQVAPTWDDMVQTPFILKINPSMLPVMVAAVNMEGMDTTELSSLMEDEVLNRLEGIDGVASVAAQGMLEEEICVALSDMRILELNIKVQDAIMGQFEEAETELDAAERELDTAGSASLGGGMPEVDLSGIGGSMAGAAGAVVDEGLAQARAEAETQLAALRGQLKTLEDAEAQLQPIYQMMVDAKAVVDDAEAYHRQLVSMLAKYDELEARLAGFDADIPGFSVMTETERQAALAAVADPEQQARLVEAYTVWSGEKYILTAQMMAAGAADRASLEAMIEQAQATVDLANYNLQLLESAIGMSAQQVLDAWDQLQQGKTTLQGSIAALEEVIRLLDSGAIDVEGALAQMGGAVELPSLDFGLSGLTDMAGAMMDAQLQQARMQIDAGRAQLDGARESALKQARLENILTREMVSNILMAQNFAMPVGYVSDEGQDVLVSVGDTMKSVEELSGLLLFDFGIEGLEPIYLRDVADVYMADNSDEVYAKINGGDGVLLTFTKQSTYATAVVSDNIRARFDELSQQYEGLAFFSLMDQGDYIYLVVDSIISNLLWGAVFAILILLLFLRDLRPTFITLCSIPISVMFAIVLMYFSGVTINIISLSGLAVAVGMLVDNSVVVIENIYRLRHLGASAVKAAVSGAAQVAGAIISSTLTTVCVFLPIVFIEGLTRQLFTDLALTLGYSLMASLIVALTLVPAMSSGLLRRVKDKAHPLFERVMGGYRRLLRGALNHRALTLAAAVLLLVASAALVLGRGFTFMPGMEMEQVSVSLQMPEEATREETVAATDEALELISGIDGVETTGAMLSGGGGGLAGGMMGFGGGGGETGATIYVLLDEESPRTSREVGDEIAEVLADSPAEVDVSNSSGMSLDALAGSGLAINLYGEDLDELQSAAREVAGVVSEVEGIAEANDGIGDVSPELRLTVDKNRAMAKGLTTAQIYAELAGALSLRQTATSLETENGGRDVIVISGREADLDPAFVKDYSFTVTNREGEEETVWLRNLVSIEETETKNSISRENQRRTLSVSATVAPGHNVTLVSAAVREALERHGLPAGISVEYSGENESIMEAFGELVQMLLLALLLVYLVMVAQFQSLKSPFIVMFTIPLAFTGGLLALLVTGLELSVIALIGFVMLVGVIVNNGIVLVDYINQLRQDGMERREAIAEAGVTRMRPILMTSITTILGLSVMALGVGMGAALMQPIAIVSIGGLVYGTLMTLFVVPVMYDFLSRKELRKIDEEDLVVSEE